MIFRGRQPDSVVWRRFRSGLDSFSFEKDEAGGVYVAHVVANAERVLDLLHSLSGHLPPAVDVALEDGRSGRRWRGEVVALPDVRDAVARLKLPLAAYAGVELAIYSPDDQLTLTPSLELYIYGRSDRWLYILLGKGLVEQERLAGARREPGSALTPAPELEGAIEHAVERLSLEPVGGDGR